jgi:cytochrome b561
MNQATNRYTLPARALHSLVGLGIVAALVLALIIPEGEKTPEVLAAINLHRTAGSIVLLLVVLRLIWRAANRPPALPDHMKRTEQLVTHAGHALLYVAMLGVPLLGWVFACAAGLEPLSVGVSLPNLIDKQPRSVAGTLHELHELGAWALVGLAALHAIAAVKHHVMDRDGMLRRMF